MSEPTRFPLAWPTHKPRTPWSLRKTGQFRADDKPITRVAAMSRLLSEIERLGASYPLISSNLELRKSDGQPRLDRPEPSDPGVCVYFTLKGKPYAMACDTFDRLQQNIAAIAGHIEATRRIERYGVATAAEALQNFVALPQPKRPHEILGIPADATEADVKRAWRSRIADAHPDQGGTQAAAAEINAARDAMLKQIGA